jgi:hypothetical protein
LISSIALATLSFYRILDIFTLNFSYLWLLYGFSLLLHYYILSVGIKNNNKIETTKYLHSKNKREMYSSSSIHCQDNLKKETEEYKAELAIFSKITNAEVVKVFYHKLKQNRCEIFCG